MEELIGIEYTAYVALAVLLYAIRQATGISNRYIPLTAVILGIAFAMLEYETFNYDVLLEGIKYALYGVGTVATVKYLFVKNMREEERTE
ncbi:phage holin family protein [Bacillus sp. PS06]|uniref:phage holin family protein n=1 Tax=Bacillus sp. PS06 TaxID=2764176 RepID=UPI00297006D4|nr:phage holin family protein [Bacillus sp. PS06]